ncbi:MAG: glycosyltransferase family 4 protein [Acidobacteriota bacterium]|nr:glycosyltransferase family 4 protein [Acidobacteriota bacterium]
MITTFYPPYSFGGDAMYIYRLTNELARRGHLVDVFHCVDAYRVLEKNSPTADFPNHPNVKIYKLESRAGFLSPLLTQQTGVPFFKRQIKDALEANNYDVIHFHNMSLIGITALSYGSAVKLYTTHEHWLVCPMHVLWKFDREVCTKKSCLSCQISGRRPPQLWRYTGLLEKSLRHVDCFISPSRFTLNKHLEDGLDIPITHIPYFLPAPEIENLSGENKMERPFFLFVGRLERIKGLQNVIPIFKQLLEYDLLIAGDGDYKNELTHLAGDSANIKFLGRLSQTDLQKLYRRAVSIIVPSICYETFGIIIIEAFSMKTPAIVHNLGALPEVIEDSNGGFIYNDENELVDAIRKLAQNQTLRDELGNNGYRAFLKFWNEDVHLAQYLGLIEKIQNRQVHSIDGQSNK